MGITYTDKTLEEAYQLVPDLKAEVCDTILPIAKRITELYNKHKGRFVTACNNFHNDDPALLDMISKEKLQECKYKAERKEWEKVKKGFLCTEETLRNHVRMLVVDVIGEDLEKKIRTELNSPDVNILTSFTMGTNALVIQVPKGKEEGRDYGLEFGPGDWSKFREYGTPRLELGCFDYKEPRNKNWKILGKKTMRVNGIPVPFNPN